MADDGEMPTRKLLRRWIALIITTAVAATAAVTATVTWLAVRSHPNPDRLSRMSAIGEAFGTISAALSAVALIGIATSLYFQMQQTRAAQIEASRTMRVQLIQFALTNPQYLPLWGFDPEEGQQKVTESAYTSLVFAYLKMSYALRVLTDFELAGWCRVAFRQPSVADFWSAAREVYLRDASSSEARRFARLIDAVYEEVDRTPEPPPSAAISPPSTRAEGPDSGPTRNALRPAATIAFAAGLALGLAWRVLASRRHAERDDAA